MNLLNQTVYGTPWTIKATAKLSSEELAAISSASVTASTKAETLGKKSICFMLKAGGSIYVPVSRDTEDKLEVGQNVELSSITLITLQREGESDILRAEV